MLSQPPASINVLPRKGRWVCGSIKRNRQALNDVFVAYAPRIANFILSSSHSFSLSPEISRLDRQTRLDQVFDTAMDVIESLCDGIGWTAAPRPPQQQQQQRTATILEDNPQLRGGVMTSLAKKILDPGDNSDIQELPAAEIARHWRQLLASRDRACPLPVSPPERAFNMVDSPFSDTASVARYILRMPNRKAVGPDRLPAELLKVCPYVHAIWLGPLWSLCWQEGMVPSIWRVAFLYPIHKDGDRRNGGNYRGISLMSHMRKTYEYVLQRKLEQLVGPRTRFQHGFVNGRSIWGPVWGLHKELQKDLGDPQHGKPSALFVDIAKAYDTVDRNILWNKLRMRVPAGESPRLIAQVRELGDGNILLVRGSEERVFPVSVERGLPQGSSLSPILYSYFIDDLPEALELRPEATVKLFADDIAIRPATADPRELQEYCDRLSDYAERHGFTVNVKKTVLVGGTGVRLGQGTVTPSPTARYLGVQFNAFGGLFDHTHRGAVANARRTLIKLRNRGLFSAKIDAGKRLILVKTFVLSRLDFGMGLPMRAETALRVNDFYDEAVKTALTGGRYDIVGWNVNLRATTGLAPFSIRREVSAIRTAFLSYGAGVPWGDCAELLTDNRLWPVGAGPGAPADDWESRQNLKKEVLKRQKAWISERCWYRPVGVQSPVWEHEQQDWVRTGWMRVMRQREPDNGDWRRIIGRTATLGHRKRIHREPFFAELEEMCRMYQAGV